MSKINWNDTVKELIKSELSQHAISTDNLAKYLAAIGVNETKASISSKISRGTFSASFLLQVLTSIGCERLELNGHSSTVAFKSRSRDDLSRQDLLYVDQKTGTRFIDLRTGTLNLKTKPTVISLFSGAGGLDIGLEQAGYETLVCVDNDQDCIETLKYNRPKWKVFEEPGYKDGRKLKTRPIGDIRFISPEELMKAVGKKKGEVTLVVGGAPCQPFSNIGKKHGKNDVENGDLFLEFVRMVRGIEPKAFIFENVVGITQKRHQQVLNYMIKQFKGMDFGISHTVLNAANYGVGQRRERFFLIGIKGVEKPAFPIPTHFKDERSWSMFVRYFDKPPVNKPAPWVSVKQVFASLPKNYKKREDYAVMGVSSLVQQRMKLVSQGENFKALPDELRPDCWKSGKHQGSDTFGRLVDELPSVTIRTAAYNSAKGRYIHPNENRGLNTIEMAALQSFPKDWIFRSNGRTKVTLVSCGRQIGNAVPPLLAESIGKSILYQIGESNSKRGVSVSRKKRVVR